MKKLLLATLILAAPALAETRIDLANDEIATATQELLAKGHDIPNPCAALLRECFAYGQDEFTACLSTSGQHPFCEGTPLGKLAMKRWSMNSGVEGSKAFTGPSMTDRECLNNFDATFSGALTQGSLSTESIEKLQSSLNSCNREAPVDFLRP